jgi:hypothetical protein
VKIDYEITENDMKYLIFFHTWGIHKWRTASTVFLAGIVTGLLTFIAVYNYKHQLNDAVVMGIATSVIGWAVCGWVIQRLPAKLARKAFLADRSGNLFGWHSLELNADGIVESTESSQTKHAWRAIESVLFTKDYVIIYVGYGLAHAVRREFATGDFVSELRHKLPSECLRGEWGDWMPDQPGNV